MATDQEFKGQVPGVGDGGGASSDVASADAASTAGDGDQGQPKPVDLTTLPEFKKWQSAQDRKMAELQTRLSKTEADKEQTALAGMDKYEQAQFLAEKNARRAKELEDQLVNIQAETYRQQRLTDISTRYGVPLDQLDDNSPEAALQSALDYVSSGKPRKGTTGAAAPRVDVGGGSPRGQAERLKERYVEAKKAYDSAAMIRIAVEAEGLGVSLD